MCGVMNDGMSPAFYYAEKWKEVLRRELADKG